MYQPRKYKVLRTDRAANKGLTVGQFVYDCRSHDYGCASDDTRGTGIEHTSVTLDPDGGYPFFTIPVADIRAHIELDAGDTAQLKAEGEHRRTGQ